MSLGFLFLQDSAQLGYMQVPRVASKEWQDGRWLRKGLLGVGAREWKGWNLG